MVNSLYTYVIKQPSLLLPLGIGQSEQYGFYQKLSMWSSPFDSDIAEEISNYERLINGNEIFIHTLFASLLLIILTFNINGLEKDLNLKINFIQAGGIKNGHSVDCFFILFLFLLLLIVYFYVAILNNVLIKKYYN